MLKLIALLALSAGAALAQEDAAPPAAAEIVETPATAEEDPEMVPRAEWARPPSDVEATLVDGKAMTGGATGGATGGGAAATGTVGNPRAPQATDNAPCDDCGTSQDKVLEDGSNKRPIIP